MPSIDLNTYIFPKDDSGLHSALPKQQEFMNMANDPKGPQVLGYFGGVGSGKSVVLCGTILSQAIQFGGDWVIARLYMPELRRTTMKAFLDMVPPELLLEHRIAENEIRLKTLTGKPASVYFVGLDEPTKLLSLNLSGAGIDEATEVSEEAFLLLLNRLRNKQGLRKLYLVGNPRGHNWVYRYLIQKKNIKDPSRYHMILAPTTENRHLPDGYVQGMLDTYSPERIKRDIMGSFDSFEGQVYSEFDRALHVVRPFKIPVDWDRHIRIDHGYKNPAAVGFYAISPDGDVYKYREIYVREHLIKDICAKISDYTQGATSGFRSAKIDPSTKARRGTTGTSDWDEYVRHWPKGLPMLQIAKNDVQVGIDRMKQYLRPDPKTKQPSLFFFETCINTLEEIATYRYPELRPGEQGNKAEKEAPLKVNDHAMDETRYMIVDLPERYKVEVREQDRWRKFNNIEISFQDTIAKLKGPKDPKDPFGDGI